MKYSIFSILSYICEGLIGIAVGIFAILHPQTALNIAAVVFSVALAIKGLRSLVDAIRVTSVTRKINLNGVIITDSVRSSVRASMIINALVSAIIGVAALIFSIICFLNDSQDLVIIVVYLIGVGFVVSGILGLVSRYRMRNFLQLTTYFSDKSLFNIVAGVLLLIFPLVVGQTLIYAAGYVIIFIGAIAVIVGTVLLVKLVKFRRLEKATTATFREMDAENK